MRLTAFTDYGLRTLMLMAGAPARVFTTMEIAGLFQISHNHLTKIVRELSAAGFVTTLRGAGGGLMLARPPGKITIGDVVRRMEARQSIVECFREDGGSCVLTPTCRLKSRLGKAAMAFLAELDKSTLADCAADPATLGASTPALTEARTKRRLSSFSSKPRS
jgi:Rrf2 family transcriptional regulator, nitric oxide-sensitive transcriptional repressor